MNLNHLLRIALQLFQLFNLNLRYLRCNLFSFLLNKEILDRIVRSIGCRYCYSWSRCWCDFCSLNSRFNKLNELFLLSLCVFIHCSLICSLFLCPPRSYCCRYELFCRFVQTAYIILFVLIFHCVLLVVIILMSCAVFLSQSYWLLLGFFLFEQEYDNNDYDNDYHSHNDWNYYD